MAKNWAIAIGINDYEHLPRPLRYAQRDAELVRDWLENRAGFEKVYYFADNSPKIGNTSTRPTRSTLLRTFDTLFKQPFLGAGDNFWFFFSGHGVRHEGQDYLMAADSYPENIPDSAIPVSYILGRLRRCGADNIVLLLDACRDGVGKSIEGMGRETAKQAQQMGVISIASCSPAEMSYEVEALEQGVFTYALLEGLGVQGKCATVERLNAYLARRVPQLSWEYVKRTQTPLTTAEPIDRAHLILVPEYATQKDIDKLKWDASRAERQKNWTLARQLWIRVNAAAMGMDLDVIEAIEYIAVERLKYSKSESSANVSGGKNPFDRISQPSTSTRSRDGIVENGINTRTFRFEVVTVNEKGKEIDRRPSEAKSFTEKINGVPLEMVAIPGGSFQMGSPEGEGYDNERPQHSVTVQPFLMGKYPVTQAQWQAVANLPKVDRDLEPDPSDFQGKNRPVERVSWYDAVEFCQRLSKVTRRDYRLPSEAEWEYACRAGTTTPFHFGATLISQLANYNGSETFASEPKGEYRRQTTEIGSFPANAFGLYDMHGNVWEWCADDWHKNYDGALTDGSARTDKKKEVQDTNKVLRGGSWVNFPDNCRSASRDGGDPTRDSYVIGFRVLCAANQ